MKKDKLFLILLILSMVIWGISWSSAKVLSQYGNVLSIAYVRFWIVVLTLFPILKITKTNIVVKKEGWLYVLGAGFFFGLYSLIFFSGLQHGVAGSGGVVVTTFSPIFAFILGVVVSRKWLVKMEYVGLGIGLVAGGLLLELWKNSEEIFASGNLYFVVGALVWAFMSKVSSKATQFGHALSFNFWLHVATTIGLSFLVDFQDVFILLKNGDSTFWWNLIYFGVINSTCATACYLYATTRLGAEKASTFIFLVPVSAVFGSWFFLGELVEYHTILGGVLGVLAVFVINGRIFKRINHSESL